MTRKPTPYRITERSMRTASRFLLLLLSALLPIFAVRPAHAQPAVAPPVASTTLASATPAITLDARSLDRLMELDLPWRYHTATNASDRTFASPTFDDSAWPAILPGPTFASAHQPNLETQVIWARIHLRIANPSAEKLGILLDSRSGVPYAVFANGQPIAASRSFVGGQHRVSQPFVIALPQASEITLAIEIHIDSNTVFHYLPIQSLSIGELNLVTSAAELNRVRHFDSLYLITILEAILYLGFVPVAFILFRNQKGHTEYLWLGLFLFGQAIYDVVGAFADGGGIPITKLTALLIQLLVLVGLVVTSLELILILSGITRRLPARIFQAFLILSPLTFLINQTVNSFGIVFNIAVWLIFLITSLVIGYRRGRTECGILLIPLCAYAGSALLLLSQNLFGVRLPFRATYVAGPIRFDLGDVSLLAFLAALIGLILFRFIRTSREEQRSASELEAARTVQQVLVPEDTPSIPGYHVATLYRPAQQVGGDFFQIVPLPSGNLLLAAGDVTGKGLQAGMLVALLVGAIRTASDFSSDPLLVLNALNRRLLGRGASQATCLAMLVTPTGAVTLANAGHIPPYLNGEPFDMQGALPLGMIDEADFSVMHFQLNPSDKLVVVSDGILEATSPTGELFGFDRTAAMLKSHQTIEQVADAAQSFSQTSAQQDDISLVQLTRTA